jgi:hypothetical protein
MACIDRPGEYSLFGLRVAKARTVPRPEAPFLDVQVAQARIDDGRVSRVVVRDQEFVDGADRVVVIGERDRHDAQRVVGELTAGARKLLERNQRMRVLGEHGAIEHTRE